VALEVHPWRRRCFYRKSSLWIAGVEVEVKKMEKDILKGNRGKGRRKMKKMDTRTTRFEDRYDNRSSATAPEMLLGIS
jgi:hypothetical protein